MIRRIVLGSIINKHKLKQTIKNPETFMKEQNIFNLLPAKLQSPTETMKGYKKRQNYFSSFFAVQKNQLAQY